MKHIKFVSVILLFMILISKSFALEIPKNRLRIFAATTNDKFSYGISQNKDDQLTASNEIHVIFPYLFLDINLNGITNRGTKTDFDNPLTFTSGRYDELIIKSGIPVSLFSDTFFDIDFISEIGFCLLGNYGMEFEQNLNHQSSGINAVNLKYEDFEYPFSPLINSKLSISFKPLYYLKFQFSFSSNNYIFYKTDQNISLNTFIGNKTLLNIFAGYTWNQFWCSSSTLKTYNNVTEGFNFGFNLDTGLIKLDFINYSKTNYGLGTINVDFMNLFNHNWEKTDIHLYTGMSFFIGTEFLETQIQTKSFYNFSLYYNNKYVSGFKTNNINPSEYRYERDYVINTIGVKYEQPLPFIKNWITPYIELGTGIASFGIQKLANHIPDSKYDYYKYDTKLFWELEANIGFDIIPQGFLNFGNSSYSLTIFAGTIFIPDYVNATKQIKLDTYQNNDWSLNPFEFKFGFAVHFGLDF